MNLVLTLALCLVAASGPDPIREMAGLWDSGSPRDRERLRALGVELLSTPQPDDLAARVGLKVAELELAARRPEQAEVRLEAICRESLTPAERLEFWRLRARTATCLAAAGAVSSTVDRLLALAGLEKTVAGRHRMEVMAALVLLEADRPVEALRVLGRLAPTEQASVAALEVDLLVARAEFLLSAAEADPGGRRRLCDGYRERLESAWNRARAALARRAMPERPATEALVSSIALDLVHAHLYHGARAEARSTLERFLADCGGSGPALPLERALADLDRLGQTLPDPAAELVPVEPRSRPGDRTFSSTSGDSDARVIQFWAAWDRASVHEWEAVDRLHQRLGALPGVRLMAVSVDEATREPTVRAMLETRAPRWPQFRAARAWESPSIVRLGLAKRGVPTRLVVDRRGLIVAIDPPMPHLSAWIRRLAAQPGGRR